MKTSERHNGEWNLRQRHKEGGGGYSLDDKKVKNHNPITLYFDAKITITKQAHIIPYIKNG